MTKRRTLVEAAQDILNANLADKGKGEPFGAGFTRPASAQLAGSMKSDSPTGHGDFAGGPIVDPDKAGQNKAIANAPKATPPGTSPQAASDAPMQNIHQNHGPDGQHRASPTDDGVVHEDKKVDEDKVAEGVTTDTTKAQPETMRPEGNGVPTEPKSDINTAKPISDRVKNYFKEKGAALAVAEDINAIFTGQDLSEDFKARARLVFEAAVISTATRICEALEEEYVTQLSTVSESMKDTMATKLDEYMTFMTEQWLKDNQVAVEKSLRTDLMESFVEGLRNLFAEHYIDVPEEKAGVIDEMASEIEQLQNKLNESIEQNVALTNQMVSTNKTKIFESVVSGLTDVQVSKVKSLAETVTWTNPTEYTKSLETLKETYFPKDKVKTGPESLNEDTARDKAEDKDAKVLVEDNNTPVVDPKMARYVRTIQKQVNHN